jgi:DNA polymerase-3 subunit epsilon
LTRGLLPRLRRRNLDALARHYGIPIHGRHRALGDAMATARILLRLLDEAANLGIHDLDTLRRHSRRRARRKAPPVRRAPRTSSDDDAG